MLKVGEVIFSAGAYEGKTNIYEWHILSMRTTKAHLDNQDDLKTLNTRQTKLKKMAAKK